MLDVRNLSVTIGDHKIVDDVSFQVKEKQWLMIVGPNGAGKSTVINAVSQGIPYTGAAYFEGENIANLKPIERAKKIGVLMQYHYVGYSFTVEEVVKLGRYAYSPKVFSTTTDENAEKVKKAMEITGVLPIKDQSVLTLSGGEMQRTFLAQLLAQDPQMLILDEPTNHLDLVYQKLIFELVKEWIKKTGRSVVSVVHDLSLAKAYGTHAVLMEKGKVVAYGPMDQVFTNENLKKTYSMDVQQWMRNMLSFWT
ncbi:MAG: ABC transporter ATP-binding protein [Anaerovoracaceae bacterium]|jgi:iron complex transport system ATP-binding protein